MNILVTGANGQLGNEMRLIAKNCSDKYIFTDINQVEGVETTYLDITDLDAIRKMVVDNDVKVIVNCAAWTNVDACETDEKLAALAEKLNAEAPKYLAVSMKEVGGLLVHVSTDYVFGGEPYNTPCSPGQQGTPTGVYGATKKHGEENIIASGCDYVILRTAWLYSEFGKKFCKTMLNLTATKPASKVVFDQCGTPTYALDLAKAIVEVVEDYKKETLNDQRSTLNYTKSGIYHYSNEGVTSWYDFTQMIAKIADNTDCDIQPCYSSEYPSPVKRPAYSVLDKKTFKEAFGVSVPYWVDSLETCIRNIKNQNQ
jgi:dTDP-4-dehydrorhamnose reductase